MNCKGYGRKWPWPNFKALLQNLPGGTEENHETPQSGWPACRPRFEPGTSQIRSTSVYHSMTMFSDYGYVSSRAPSSACALPVAIWELIYTVDLRVYLLFHRWRWVLNLGEYSMWSSGVKWCTGIRCQCTRYWIFTSFILDWSLYDLLSKSLITFILIHFII
jgi:hypothetical protein